jgi:hypothetical protein
MADELRIQWNIGNDCNYNCSYCHSDLKNGSNPFPNLDKLRVGFDNIVRQAQPFSLINYTNSNGVKFNLYTNFINFINLKLTDQNGVTLNLNNQHWSITLQLN